MGEVVSFASHRNKKAADRGFAEWKRLFGTVAKFDEHTRWADLPDEVVLFFCEESPASKNSFYDLIMGSNRLGIGHDFEAQPFEQLSDLLNVYFFVTDQARFECMRRLGWLQSIPRAADPIIEIVMDPATYEYASLLETPPPTPAHPGCQEDEQTKGIDRAAVVRKYAPHAINLFKQKIAGETSVEL